MSVQLTLQVCIHFPTSLRGSHDALLSSRQTTIARMKSPNKKNKQSYIANGVMRIKPSNTIFPINKKIIRNRTEIVLLQLVTMAAIDAKHAGLMVCVALLDLVLVFRHCKYSRRRSYILFTILTTRHYAQTYT